ncbi:MAG: SMI1/KNR4 family protein [Candidatus Lokiarchaeota archaeon]|nr:SMI1/KNR4 family protein [Candidatus Lokiarchaeota archaeon]MBD3198530.1 SMI1/KNR4 family protein [Candidatus Lokiarchaeota archaeon]
MIENHRSLHEKIRGMKEWKTKITLISDEWKITDPANPDFIEQIEHKFHIRLPEELLNLYNETNGVKDQFSYDIIFPVQDLLKRNQEMRNDDGFKSLYMPFDHLLFIGEYGNGDLFGYPISMKGKIKKRSIFIWNHENDSWEWAAMSIVDLFIRAICGFFD